MLGDIVNIVCNFIYARNVKQSKYSSKKLIYEKKYFLLQRWYSIVIDCCNIFWNIYAKELNK